MTTPPPPKKKVVGAGTNERMNEYMGERTNEGVKYENEAEGMHDPSGSRFSGVSSFTRISDGWCCICIYERGVRVSQPRSQSMHGAPRRTSASDRNTTIQPPTRWLRLSVKLEFLMYAVRRSGLAFPSRTIHADFVAKAFRGAFPFSVARFSFWSLGSRIFW